MGDLKICIYPDAILREKCAFVANERFGSCELSDKASQMFFVMKSAGNGIGLAGPQAGLKDHMFIVDLTYDEEGKDFIAFDLKNDRKPIENQKLIVINSSIKWKSKEMHAAQEGCLSLPKISVWVNRPKKIHLNFFDEKGIEYLWEMDSLLAKCCQHEIDHLNGKMIIDYKGFRLNSERNKKEIDNALSELEKKFHSIFSEK
jgi:peptide deformylase